jgi:SSS family solute:Na+ symporter
VALLAGIISAIGISDSVPGFGWSKLASATIDGLNIQTALIVMGVIAVAYTLEDSNLYILIQWLMD